MSATFELPIVLTHFTIGAASELSKNPRRFEIQGSNDGGLTWDTIFLRDTLTTVLFSEELEVIRFNAGTHYALPAVYRTIRFFCYHADHPFRLGELEFFGHRHTTRLTPVAPIPDGDVAIEWASIPHVTYQLERSTDLNTWTIVQSGIPSGGATTTITDESLPTPAPGSVFYRVRIE